MLKFSPKILSFGSNDSTIPQWIDKNPLKSPQLLVLEKSSPSNKVSWHGIITDCVSICMTPNIFKAFKTLSRVIGDKNQLFSDLLSCYNNFINFKEAIIVPKKKTAAEQFTISGLG